MQRTAFTPAANDTVADSTSTGSETQPSTKSGSSRSSDDVEKWDSFACEGQEEGEEVFEDDDYDSEGNCIRYSMDTDSSGASDDERVEADDDLSSVDTNSSSDDGEEADDDVTSSSTSAGISMVAAFPSSEVGRVLGSGLVHPAGMSPVWGPEFQGLGDRDCKEQAAAKHAPRTCESLTLQAAACPLPGPGPSLRSEDGYCIRSIFADGPPVLYFPGPDEPASPLPSCVKSKLVLRSGKFTPTVVKEVVRKAGFKVVRGPFGGSARRREPWLLYWGRHVKTEQFRGVCPWQIVNHAPGSFEIGRKDKLLKTLRKMYQIKVGPCRREDEFSGNQDGALPPFPPSWQRTQARTSIEFLPATYILPQDRKQLKRAFREARREARAAKKPEKAVWIIKPPAAARGIGVRLVKKWGEVPKRKDAIVSRYIYRPFLIEGRKFDIRLYVLVTSFEPLRAYVFGEGISRFSAMLYKPPKTTKVMRNRFIHLTNTSITKRRSKSQVAPDANDDILRNGCKWSLAQLRQYLEERHQVDTAALFERIHDVIRKTLLSASRAIAATIRQSCRDKRSCFELFGFDILLDEKLKPWLMEVNISPSLNTNSQLDKVTKGELVRGLFNLVGVPVPAGGGGTGPERGRSPSNAEFALLKRQQRLLLAATASGPSQGSLLDDLSDDDVRVIRETEDEFARRGRFLRLFPSKDHRLYDSRNVCYYDLLLFEWTYRRTSWTSEEVHRMLQYKRPPAGKARDQASGTNFADERQAAQAQCRKAAPFSCGPSQKTRTNVSYADIDCAATTTRMADVRPPAGIAQGDAPGVAVKTWVYEASGPRDACEAQVPRRLVAFEGAEARFVVSDGSKSGNYRTDDKAAQHPRRFSAVAGSRGTSRCSDGSSRQSPSRTRRNVGDDPSEKRNLKNEQGGEIAGGRPERSRMASELQCATGIHGRPAFARLGNKHADRPTKDPAAEKPGMSLAKGRLTKQIITPPTVKFEHPPQTATARRKQRDAVALRPRKSGPWSSSVSVVAPRRYSSCPCIGDIGGTARTQDGRVGRRHNRETATLVATLPILSASTTSVKAYSVRKKKPFTPFEEKPAIQLSHELEEALRPVNGGATGPNFRYRNSHAKPTVFRNMQNKVFQPSRSQVTNRP